jgi:Fe-S-cluster-containing hydrogenase component 2
MSYKRGQALTDDELKAQLPPVERLRQGPVAIIECIEQIPCNPCVDSCPRGAITMPGGLNQIPQLDVEACTGCGLCISSCPGLAIFVVDLSGVGTVAGKVDAASVSLPYEFLPLPEKGQQVLALDRTGRELGPATVIRIRAGKRVDRTSVVTIAVPMEWAQRARQIKIDRRQS